MFTSLTLIQSCFSVKWTPETTEVAVALQLYLLGTASRGRCLSAALEWLKRLSGMPDVGGVSPTNGGIAVSEAVQSGCHLCKRKMHLCIYECVATVEVNLLPYILNFFILNFAHIVFCLVPDSFLVDNNCYLQTD